MSRQDEYYSKLFEVLHLLHTENIAIAQSMMRLCKDGHNNYDVEQLCDQIESSWNEAFNDIRKW